MSSIPIDTVKAALRAWVIRGSGLAADHVIWTLGERAPTAPYVQLRLTIAPIGRDRLVVTQAPNPTPGAEALYTAIGDRAATLRLQCFADETSQNERAPEQILADVVACRVLPSVAQALSTANVGVVRFGPITPIDATINRVYFEPRAALEIVLRLTSQVSEQGPSIAVVEIEGTTDQIPVDFAVTS